MAPEHTRAKELSILHDAIASTQQGNGISMLLNGSQGIGKSWLITQLERIAQDSGMLSIVASATPEDAMVRPFGFVLDILNQNATGHEPKWREKLAEIAACIPSIAKSLALDSQATNSVEIDQARAQFLARMYRLIIDASVDQPMLFCLDDANLADSGSIQFLNLLAERNDQNRVMVVASYATDGTSGTAGDAVTVLERLKRHDHVRSLRLGPLGIEDTRSLIQSRFPKNSFSSGMSHLIHQRTKGVPLAVVQYLEDMSHRQLIRKVGGTWIADELDNMTIDPASVSETIDGRLSHLATTDREVLGHASVQGQVFLERFLVKTRRWSDQKVGDTLTRLISQTGAFKAIQRGAFRFIHPLVRESCLKLLTEEQRNKIHLALAELLLEASASPILVAHHLCAAEEYERALDPLLSAAHLAHEGGQYREATEIIEQAEHSINKMGADATPVRHVAVCLLKSDITGKTGDFLGSEAAASAVLLNPSASPVDRANALLSQGWALRGLARFDQALASLEKARILFKDLGDNQLLSTANLRTAHIHFECGNYEKASKTYVDLAAQGVDELPILVANGEMSLGIISSIQGDFYAAITHLNRSLKVFTEHNHADRCRVLHNLGMVDMDMEDYAQAFKKFSMATELASDLGLFDVVGNSAISEAEAAAHVGDLPHASTACKRAKYEFSKNGDVLGLCECLKVEGMIARENGNHDEAESTLRDAMTQFDTYSNPLGVAESEYELGLTFITTGKSSDALAILTAAQSKFEALGARADVDRCNRHIQQLGS